MREWVQVPFAYKYLWKKLALKYAESVSSLKKNGKPGIYSSGRIKKLESVG